MAIVGGGIVGVTAARLLKDRGVGVALVEARRVGRQVTGKSTAKVSSQHGSSRYQDLVRNFGEHRARLYAEAQEAGVRQSRSWRPSTASTPTSSRCPLSSTRRRELRFRARKEVEVARRLGLPATLTRDTGLPFDVLAAMRWDGQAQFHPVKYVAGLAATLPGGGCHVFENSRAVDYEPTRVVTERGKVTARHVVLATHLPLGQIGMFYATNYPKAEPMVAAPIRRHARRNTRMPGRRAIRSGRTGADGQVYGIVAGTHFKPGHPDEARRWPPT